MLVWGTYNYSYSYLASFPSSCTGIRVDFEYIPEDLAYQRNLQGVSGSLNLPGERVTVDNDTMIIQVYY